MTQPAPPTRPPSPRTAVRRVKERGAYDRETVAAILDEGLVAHVGFAVDGAPFVIPMAYARDGDRLLLHGAGASRLMKHLAGGEPVCVTVTLLDGLVVARSLFDHSMNYRSVVVFGNARPIREPEAKEAALVALAERILPGRSAEARGPSPQELAATEILELPLAEASAKIRSGPPKDSEVDLGLPVWAGVLPLHLAAGDPEPAPDLLPGVEMPASVRGWRRDGR